MPGFRPEAAFQELRDPRAPEVARKSFSPGQNAPVGESTGYRLRTGGIRGGTPPCGFAQDSGKPIKGQEIVRQG